MKVKNIGGKIINIGDAIVLPGETKCVPDTFSGNEIIRYLEERGNLVDVKDSTQIPAVNAETPTKQQEGGAEKKYLSRMNKAELADECRKLGIEVSEEDTKDTLAEKIKAATTE